MKQISYCFLVIFALLFLRCATDPGSSTPVSGGAVTFTYATGDVRVLVDVQDRAISAGAVLFDTDPATGSLAQATAVESGLTVTWPDELSFSLPNCSATPTLSGSTTYTTSKIFNYTYPSNCSPAASSAVSGQATVVLTKNGSSRTINDTTSTVTTQTFTSNGTWTAPTGVTSVTAECWGGGGGGGASGPATGGSGGGGGGYSKKTAISVTPGATYTVTVGTGGTQGLFAGATNGGNGGDTWFSTSGTVLAKGGTGGQSVGGASGTGGSSAAGVGDTKLSGGNGGVGHGAGGGGGGGSSAGTAAGGNSAASPSGAAGTAGGTAPSGGGDGGAGGNGGSAGANGVQPGGAGGGGGNTTNGAAGANGKVILNW